MKRIFNLLFLTLFLSIAPVVGFAQSASESYNKGIALMDKKDYNGAIASFKASMAINKSAANVKKCKAKIAKCNKLAKSKNISSEATSTPTIVKDITATAYTLNFNADDDDKKVVGIETIPESNDWTANVEPDGNEWCKLSKSIDSKDLYVNCLPSNTTIMRSTGINIIYDKVTRFIKVNQKGRRPQLYTDKSMVKINKRKGGVQKLIITCNSDTLYSNNKNWELVKYPSWCNVEFISSNELSIKANKIEKGDALFKNGRNGDLIIRSQEEQVTINVEQR